MKDTTTSRQLDEGMDVDELTRLIVIVGTYYGFSDDEFRMAFHAATNDRESALVCYRDLASRIHPAHRPSPKEATP